MADKFDQWAILEVMGHQKFAGRVSEQAVGGAFTKLFGGGSIYCITPVTEEVARGLAGKLRNEPVQPWELPESYKPKPALVLAQSPEGPPTCDDDLDDDLEELRDEDD